MPQAIKLGRAQVRTRTVNVEPWEPLPGWQCPVCRYLWAVPVAVAEAEETPLCPDCVRSRR